MEQDTLRRAPKVTPSPERLEREEPRMRDSGSNHRNTDTRQKPPCLLRTLVLLLLSGAIMPALAGADPLVYIANRGAAAVTVIDAETQTIVETIAVSDQPLDQDLRWVDVRPDGGAVYVTGDAHVFVIDPASGTVTTTIPTTGPNRDLAIHPNSSLVYVADANVAVIETSGHAIVDTITIAGTPYGVTLTPDATQLYVTTLEGTVEVIDVNTRASVASIAVGGAPKMVAFTPDGQRAYVTDTSDDAGQVTVLNTSTQAIVTTIAVGGTPYGVAVTPDGGQVYVAEGANGIAVIETGSQTVTGTIAVMAVDVAITPDGTQAIATQWQTGEVMLIEIATQQVTATLGAVGAWGIGITPEFIPAATPPEDTPEDPPAVTLVDGIDLVVSITKVKRRVKDAGDKVTVKVEVCNNGSDPAQGPFDVGMFISGDENVASGATPLQTFTLDSLASGECQQTVKKERRFKLTSLPVTLGLVVVVVVDSEDQVSESNESNNLASQPISADLAVSITKVKRKVKDAGEQLVVKVEVCNTGPIPAQGPFDVGMFLSEDGSVDAAATPLQTFTLDALAPGECKQTVKKERKFKVTGLPGTLGQVVVVAVDSAEQVSEHNELNNQASQVIEEAL